MKKLIFGSIFLSVIYYLSIPLPDFPEPPPGSLLSLEPADTESIYRRAYYTDLTRSEIMDHYHQEFLHPLQFTHNLPPEDAFMVIRDQTRSSFLEEIILPWKASLYVNGFVPQKPEDVIERGGRVYANKVTVRMVPSHLVTRLTVLGLLSVCLFVMHKEYV